jgi:hypothetical protein
MLIARPREEAAPAPWKEVRRKLDVLSLVQRTIEENPDASPDDIVALLTK